MSSIKLGWNFILSLPELNQHLPKPDLLNNGQVSSYIRSKLRPLIFKTINISEAIDLIPEDITYEGTFDEKYEALNSEFSHVQKLVKRTELDLNTDPILTPVIVNYFENINSLTISEAIFPHPTFKMIFNTLKKLKILKINYTLILFHPLANEEEDIYLPESLTTLFLTQMAGVKTSQFENIQTFMNNESDDESDATAVNLRLSTNFPNLKKLRFLRGNEQVIMTLEQFILPNSQLEIVEIFIDQINPQLFNLLETHCKNLKSVRIYPSSEGPLLSNEIYNYPALPSVETLNLFKLYYYESDILLNLVASFPNISHLIISNTYALNSPIFDYIQNLEKLTKLTIYLGESESKPDIINLKSNKLTRIEFKNFENFNFFTFDILDNLPKVNNIKIETKGFESSELDTFYHYVKYVAGWRAIKFEDSAGLYKL
ncbi:hypothetical protein CONCODRAFT_20571 [Conidiobolus coronatus NRRL 28638]|uniref:F-box domain-containing protein n=1 Tax=Conidiobolus coronatus (strain ATCC 28846 / CBS 209.66 / NRRL 28638) TaxID=796925 RepID=A0A137NSN5_CONC2|nr:hypothetical protein CONCODRAFT_20571 [Conidiobolus coronatus NRRL 28638]|eukprot:KXN65775.1 hypothetical protein CONCODRAFT_20571 [Conidiobolus coronatus NRRL 28638]